MRAGGYIDGDIRISGHPKDQRTFARISGYVEQTDVHAPQVPHLHVQSLQRHVCPACCPCFLLHCHPKTTKKV